MKKVENEIKSPVAVHKRPSPNVTQSQSYRVVTMLVTAMIALPLLIAFLLACASLFAGSLLNK